MGKVIQYRREYQKRRYHLRRNRAIEYLGGKCTDCGIDSNLEFDHRNPKDKSFNVSSVFVGAPDEVLYAELDKCDLRCMACHAHKTTFQRLEKIDVLRLDQIV